MMNVLAWFSRSQCEFVNGSQAAVLRSYLITGGLAIPKCQQIEARHRNVFAAPRYIDSDDINFFLGDLRETRDHVDKMFEPANIGGIGIVHPAVDVNEKKRTLCLANHIERSCSL